MHHVEDLVVVMGRENVAILVKDNKALIPLGLHAANKQSPIMINKEYPVTLPDRMGQT